MARIYTRTGDAGDTALIGGARASKSDLRVDLYGEVDELNGLLGLARSRLRREDDWLPESLPRARALDVELAALQARLFDLGAVLADPARCETIVRTAATPAWLGPERLEESIDSMDAALPALRVFILPSGCEAGAVLHLARSTCRRVERRAVAAAATIAVPPAVIVWLNRLSDWLFVAARWINDAAGVPETPWTAAADDDEGTV